MLNPVLAPNKFKLFHYSPDYTQLHLVLFFLLLQLRAKDFSSINPDSFVLSLSFLTDNNTWVSLATSPGFEGLCCASHCSRHWADSKDKTKFLLPAAYTLLESLCLLSDIGQHAHQDSI